MRGCKTNQELTGTTSGKSFCRASRVDFQNPHPWNRQNQTNTTIDIQHVVPGRSTPTSANWFGNGPRTVPIGGVPAMNATVTLSSEGGV